MKIFQKNYENIDFDKDSIENQKMITEYDLSDQLGELKKIKSRLEFISSRFGNTFNKLHLACVIIKKDEDGDYIIVECNEKAKEIDKLDERCPSRKLKDIYGSINNFGIIDIFDEVLETGEPQKHQGFYEDKKLKGYRDSYIYRIEIEDGEDELVSIYEDVTHIKQMEKYNRLLKKLLRYRNFLFLFAILVIFIIGHISYDRYYSNREIDYDEIYTEYYKNDLNGFNTTRNGSSDLNNVLNDGIRYFDNGEFNEAILCFNKIDDNIMVNFYMGVSHMEIG